MRRFEAALVSVNRGIVAAVLAAVFGIVFVNVVGRYFFGNSLAWGEEAARHLMVFGTFAGAGLALRERRLVSIDALAEMLPGRWALAIRWFAVVAMAVMMLALLWLGSQFVAFGWRNTTMATGMPKGVPYLAIPIGAALFLIHLAFFARRFVAQEFEPGVGEPVVELHLDDIAVTREGDR
jgi:TRAP-type C4-dicarboxylate transport system permease small subunit